jgi:hypothetical protein
MDAIVAWAGLLITLAGAVWMAYLAWANNEALWAVGCFCLAPIVGTIYGILHFDEGKIPLGLIWAGILLRVAAIFIPSG